MELSRQEYPAMLATLPPSRAVTVLSDRIKHVATLNSEIADWLQERRRVEELYVQGLRKLARKQPPSDSSDLGIFSTPWQRIVAATESLAESHNLLAQKIEVDVERPLRDFTSKNRDMQAMSTIQGNLLSMARDIENAQKKSDKLQDKGLKAAADKVSNATSEVENANSQWESQAPYVFEKLQQVDESRLNHLRDVLTQFQTHEVDQVERNRITAEQCLNSLLNVETTDGIRTFSARTAEGKQRPDRARRPLVSSATSAPSVQPNDVASQRSESVGQDTRLSGFRGLRRFGTVLKGRRQSAQPLAGESPQEKKSNLGTPPRSSEPRRSRTDNTRAPFESITSSTRTPVTADATRSSPSVKPLEPERRSRNARQPSDRQLDGMTPGVTPASPGIVNGASTGPLGQLQEPLQDKDFEITPLPPLRSDAPIRSEAPSRSEAPIHSEVPIRSEAANRSDAPIRSEAPIRLDALRSDAPILSEPLMRSEEPIRSDPISQAQREAAEMSDGAAQQFKVDIRDAPIQEEVGDNETAMANVANTLRAQAVQPRKTGTLRGRRDVRNTMFVPSSLTPELTGTDLPPGVATSNSSMLPLTPPLSASAGFAAAQLSPFKAPQRSLMSEDHTASDAGSIRSMSSSTSVPPKHPELLQPGLNSSVVETVSAWFEHGHVTRVVVTGELALAYNPLHASTTSSTESIRLENFHVLEKVAPNPSFITQIYDRPGEYTVNLSNINKTAVAFKYQVHTDASNLGSQAPILLTPAWKVEPNQASVILSYSRNPSFAGGSQQPITLSNVVLMVHLEGTKASSCQSKPVGTFSKERSLIYWRLGDIILDAAQPAQKLLARFATETEAKPGDVEARWEITTENMNGLGSGLGVSTLTQGAEGAGAGADPFADESAGASTSRLADWKEVDSVRRLASGTYVATG